MEEPDIISVTELDFEVQVLDYSDRIPVLVNFWASWDDTCKRTNLQLESIALDYPGRFRLANLDIDKNPQLTGRYQVRSVPSLKTFRNGAVTHQLEGLSTSLQLLDYVKSFSPGPENLLLEKAASFLKSGRYQAVEDTCLEVLEEYPEQPRAKLLLAKSLIWRGEYLEALTLINHFPPSAEYRRAELLAPLAEGLLQVDDDAGQQRKNALDPYYFRSLQLIQRKNIAAALDGLLEILKQEKGYRGGRPRKIILGVFELVGDDQPLVVEYRSQLANVLF
jgi:putative thioredoxin